MDERIIRAIFAALAALSIGLLAALIVALVMAGLLMLAGPHWGR